MLAIHRALNNPERCQDIVEHCFILCESAQSFPTEDLLLECSCCHRFLAYCCHCIQRKRRRSPHLSVNDDDTPCHSWKVVFIDGACLGNGQNGATAGIGIAIGADATAMQWAIPIDDDIDPCSVRTSQRAELLAAIHGIRKLADFEGQPKDQLRKVKDSEKFSWVFASDSEYVVLGMTEWVPAWKSNGWRNSSGKRPKNLDLFQKLDATIERYEHEYDVRIAFWRISRVYNELADELAGLAAKGHTVAPV